MIIEREQIEELFRDAELKCYAIPHFNHSDFWDMSAIAEAAQESDTPIFIACLPKVIEAIGIEKLGAVAQVTMKQSRTPIIYHLDHCHSVELCLKAIDNGYNSVMIDAADLPLEKNIKEVKTVVDYAHEQNVHVEAEIGKIKSAGDEGYTSETAFAGLEDAKKLIEATGVDALAISIGSEHGFYKHAPKLDYELLEKIHAYVNIPLVLHGGSGIPEADVRKAINGGIRKVNVGTHIRYTYIKSIGDAIQNMGPATHTADIMASAKKDVKEILKDWIRICANK
ncbi:class II fructose-bisphosphate aldolase [Clostridium sp. C105KSO13]|uniref:class II fructose-bisphosphate aldolase n=1 Tax=Clostridium sp. C105KSO13 TaxID=1776045 RepID=UPI0007407397|nr:class II fructose-bisphosphate aldolase [Clostridium sp. C105KSO13]CUX38363.1 D-tagatose-1,6-bisphosphate aldolase subunit GatY [Clostridium sp. C105KSO13]